MYLNVREVLALPPLRELTLVAGHSGLERRVIRVSVLEIVGGPQRWWRGGELFMSTLHVLRDAACDAYVEVIHNLRDHDAAALVLHPGILGHRYLAEMRAAADDIGLPLILMPSDMPYAAVTDAVMGGLLGRQAALLELSAAVNRELTQVVLQGGSLDDICRTVAHRLGQPVAVVGADGVDVLAHSGGVSDPKHLLPDLLEHCVSGADAQPGRFPVPAALNVRGPGEVRTTAILTDQGSFNQVAAPVSSRGEVSAYLVTWELHRPLSELDYAVLAHACAAAGLEVLKQQAVLEAERRVQLDFYGAALSGAFATSEQVEHRARQAGIALGEGYVVAALGWGGQLSPAMIRELGHWPGSVCVIHDGAPVVVLCVPPACRDPLDEAAELVGQLVDAVSPPGQRITAGLSRVIAGALALPTGLAEAYAALAVAQCVRRPGDSAHPDAGTGPVRYDALGVFQLVAAIADDPRVQRFVRETLGPLVSPRGGVDLVATLEAYLDAGGSYHRAARVLYLHPNTVKYRIGRVRSLVGKPALDDPHRRLGLHLAVKVRQLTRERRA